VKSATVFGQSMRLLVNENLPEKAIENRLGEVGIAHAEIRPILPSLEDVFVSLTKSGSEKL
jgi:hypothetical protein